MKRCDRCGTVDMTVVKSRLKVEGIKPCAGCGCILLCEQCRDEVVLSYQT